MRMPSTRSRRLAAPLAACGDGQVPDGSLCYEGAPIVSPYVLDPSSKPYDASPFASFAGTCATYTPEYVLLHPDVTLNNNVTLLQASATFQVVGAGVDGSATAATCAGQVTYARVDAINYENWFVTDPCNGRLV